MNINLFDDNAFNTLRPLTFTRPVANLRVGILTIAEKWGKHLNAEYGYLTADYLNQKFAALGTNDLVINGAVCPDAQLVDALLHLKPQQCLLQGDVVIGFKPENHSATQILTTNNFDPITYVDTITRLVYPEDIFKNNDAELRKDFELLTKGRVSVNLSSTNTFLGDNIFAEEGATAECSNLNSLQGPIYLAKDSSIWEGCNIRGSFSLGQYSNVKMGAKIYGQTTIGPYCRVAGEINNAVIWGYSSKGHEGYLGNAVMGEWCNIGADTNNSNLKNNYAEVRLWDYEKRNFRKTGLQFCGLIMGDHSKCAINTSFNTGTVVGVNANIFGAGFPRNFIPDFSWGGAQGFAIYPLNKAFETAELVFDRRHKDFNQQEKDILTKVFELTQEHRHF